MALTDRPFELGRPVLFAYSATALAFSATLLLLSLRRGSTELGLWLLPYAGVALLAVLRPNLAILPAGSLAFLLGFTRTCGHGANLDLGLGLITLAVAAHAFRRARAEAAVRIDMAGLALLSIALWTVLSLGFVFVRIRGFAPAPGFAYHVYRYNLFGHSSEDVLLHAVITAASVFTWFGLYEYARSTRLARMRLGIVVFLVLVVNAAALLLQHHDPSFLQPPGLPPGRLNGVTSFCYALADACVAIYLLLPAWGMTRGIGAVLTAGSLGLLLHASFASGGRSAVLALVAAAALWAAWRAVRLFRAHRRAPAVLCLAALVVVSAASLAAYWLTPPGQSNPFGRLKSAIEHEGMLGHLRSTRLYSYPLAFRLLQAYPLSGIGVGLSPAELLKQQRLLTPGLRIGDPYVLSSHLPNQFLTTGVELGLPAMFALLVAVAYAAAVALRAHRVEGSPERAVSVLVLAGVLQLGPGLYNSEALVFWFLVIGLAVAGARVTLGHAAGAGLEIEPFVGGRATAAVLAGVFLLGLGGQLLAAPSLAIEEQWRHLRWRMVIGMQPPQPDGQWTSSEATFSVDTPARAVRLLWHVGDHAASGYRAEVAFYVDGVLVERSLASAGRVRESVLPLPPALGVKRISVRVTPPFVPAELLGGGDRRQLGVFLHSVTPIEGDQPVKP